MASRAGFRAQSAMEYLMTYGWAILIIAVVLGALFSIGVFNPMSFEPKAQPGSCQVFRPYGAGTNADANLEGVCTGEMPEFVGRFNGPNSYVSMSAADMPAGDSARSFTGWIYISDPSELTDGNRNGIFGYGTVGGGNYAYIELMALSGNLWADNIAGCYQSPLILQPNKWYFVAFTYAQGSTMYTVYLDNQKETGSCGPGSELNTPTSAIAYIGLYAYFGQGTFGYISNIQVYNTSLGTNSIDALYRSGIGGAPIDLHNIVGWWPLNGNANDYSGNSNDGTPSNVLFTSSWANSYVPP